MSDICDNRDYTSSQICDVRDRLYCDFRKDANMGRGQASLKKWIRDRLADRGHGAKKELAKHLGVRPDAITRMLNEGVEKESRRIEAAELGRIADFFGENPPGWGPPKEEFHDTPKKPISGILEIDVHAGMGGGGITEGREVVFQGNQADPVKEEAWHFPAQFMRNEIRAPENRVIVIETRGDSMSPTLTSGDRVVVDTGHKIPSPDGIYAIRDQYGHIVVKRLQTMRATQKIRIISDNKAHDAEDVGPDQIAIIGRVLWGLKRL